MPRLLFLSLLVLLLFIANLADGSISLSVAEVWYALWNEGSDTTRFIVLHHRLPQALTALLSGAALGGGGLAMQTLFRNPLADPSLLGVTAGAGLGAAVVMLLWGGVGIIGGWVLSGFLLTLGAAFTGAAFVMFLLIVVARKVNGNSQLLIVGVMLSFIVSSVVALLNFFATAEGVRSYLVWGMGDFSSVGTARLLPFCIAILPALTALFLMAKPLDALLLGEDYARSLGTDVRRVRISLLLLVGWLSAVVTAVCGPIAFIGLAAPHIARLFLHTATHRHLIPASLLIGASTALICLWVSLLPTTGGVLPLNAITPLIGAPVVLYLILKQH